MKTVRAPEALARYMNLQEAAKDLLLATLELRALVAKDANEGLILVQLARLQAFNDDLAVLIDDQLAIVDGPKAPYVLLENGGALDGVDPDFGDDVSGLGQV